MQENFTEKNYAVLITTYNGSDYIRRTIEHTLDSIKVAGYPIPVFIFDDNSSDETVQIVLECQGFYPNNKIEIYQTKTNRGLFGNKNFALQQIYKQGFAWVFLIHQDDYPETNWIDTIINITNIIDNNKFFVIWSSYNEIFNNIKKNGETSGEVSIIYSTSILINKWICNIYTPFSISGSCLNLNLLCNHSIKIFDDDFKHFGDTDFIVKNMLNSYSHIYIADSLVTREFGKHQASFRHLNSSTDIKEFILFYSKYRYLKQYRSSIYLNLFKKIFMKIIISLKSGDFAISLSHFFLISNLTVCITTTAYSIIDKSNKKKAA